MNYLLKDATLVNEGMTFEASVFVSDGMIAKIVSGDVDDAEGYKVIDAKGKFLLPGVIDEHVHFRDPGLTHKADIHSESRAAVAGGVTSFMDMPNTVPQTTTQELLQQKFDLAAEKSLANYSFYIGATNDNLEELVKTDPKLVCGVKLFMGSSTGDMLVDRKETLKAIFCNSPCLVAVHCEDESIVKANLHRYKEQYGSRAYAALHPLIRNAEACYKSSAEAVELAEQCGTQLNLMHVTTAKELELFRNDIPLADKKVTAEVSLHHLWFSDKNYEHLDNFIKCNPAIKSENDREALLLAAADGRLDTLGTDHAPHTFNEKCAPYFSAPGGMPMVQHSLCAMLELVSRGHLSMEKVVELMCHNPAVIYKVDRRGFLREGYHADLVLVDLKEDKVSNENCLYKCGWTPLNGEVLHHRVTHTFVNGHLVFEEGVFHEERPGDRLVFNR